MTAHHDDLGIDYGTIIGINPSESQLTKEDSFGTVFGPNPPFVADSQGLWSKSLRDRANQKL